MKSSDLLVQSLQQEGVQFIFGLPGEENLDLLESIRNSTIRFITCRHEQAAAFMAATYGRLTGKPGVVLSTLGPGATNLATGIAYANLGGMPLLAIAGQKPIKNRDHGHFQTVDLVALFTPITKYSQQIESGDMVPTQIRNAFKVASEERPGAVFLELPEDVAREQSAARPLKRTQVRRPSPDPKAVQIALDMIEVAHRPLLMVGAGANRKRISETLRLFIEKSEIYFFTTQMGKGIIDELHPKYLGCVTKTEGEVIHEAITNSDLIIAVGYDSFEKAPAVFNSNQKVISINFYNSPVETSFLPDLEVTADISNTVEILGRFVGPSEDRDTETFEQIKSKIQGEFESSDLNLINTSLSIKGFVKVLSQTVKENYILCLDNGQYKLEIAKSFHARNSNSVLLDNSLATMGAGLPSAIAAKLVEPNKNVIAICGDGGFMMNSQELETAIRLKLDLTVIVLKDDAYGMIKKKQHDMGFESFALDYGNPDFVKYAESYGASGVKVDSYEGLRSVLETFGSTQGVRIIEVPISYAN